MRHRKLIVLVVLMLFISISIFTIYKNTYTEELNYVVLGDSISAGRNPYGVDDYGYSDYVKDYLDNKDKLANYVSYAVSGYTVSDIINDINYNRVIETYDGTVNLKEVLRESDLVTISIGANDLLEGINLSSFSTIFDDREEVTDKIDTIIYKIDQLLELIQGYAKGEIIVIGYYNPFPNLETYKSEIDEMVDYLDVKYEELCRSKNIHYIKISDIISNNPNYLPNPFDIHPSIQGYEAISKKIIKKITEEVLK